MASCSSLSEVRPRTDPWRRSRRDRASHRLITQVFRERVDGGPGEDLKTAVGADFERMGATVRWQGARAGGFDQWPHGSVGRHGRPKVSR